jgi:hypothetical protein
MASTRPRRVQAQPQDADQPNSGALLCAWADGSTLHAPLNLKHVAWVKGELGERSWSLCNGGSLLLPCCKCVQAPCRDPRRSPQPICGPASHAKHALALSAAGEAGRARAAGGCARRQVRGGGRHHAHATGRGQEHHHHRPVPGPGRLPQQEGAAAGVARPAPWAEGQGRVQQWRWVGAGAGMPWVRCGAWHVLGACAGLRLRGRGS